MNILAIVLVIIQSVFSVGVMSYVAMATPMGPWMAPTLVLSTTLFLKLLTIFGVRWLYKKEQRMNRLNLVALIVSGSSVGGIIATAMGFSFPTLYFLDKHLFNSWMQQPIYFWAATGSLAFVASVFGYWIANVLEENLLVKQRLSFPIGQLAYRMMLAQNQERKARELAIGFFSAIVFSSFQYIKLIPRYIDVLYSHTIGFLNIPLVRFDFFPMYWAIGFVTGNVIAIPLLIGSVAKIFLVDPTHNYFFSNMSNIEFMLAFGGGLILVSTINSLLRAPQTIWDSMQRIYKNLLGGSKDELREKYKLGGGRLNSIAAAVVPSLVFFWYFDFSILLQVYLLVFTFVCTYQVANIAGRIGLAQLGRFATFVMLPAMFLFQLDMVQITIIATFVEITAGVATDVLFGRKIGQLSNIPSDTIKKYQLFGIVVSALVIGSIFWSLIHNFGLGSDELFVQRAQVRALLINVTKFNPLVLIMGMVFAYALQIININPMLALSGLLMPLNVSISLIVGGLCALYTKRKEEWFPFWSGVFASNSVWTVISSLW